MAVCVGAAEAKQQTDRTIDASGIQRIGQPDGGNSGTQPTFGKSGMRQSSLWCHDNGVTQLADCFYHCLGISGSGTTIIDQKSAAEKNRLLQRLDLGIYANPFWRKKFRQHTNLPPSGFFTGFTDVF